MAEAVLMPTIADLLKYDKNHPDKAGTSQEEKLFMYGLVRLIQPKTVVEIGVRAAHMTCWLSLAVKHNGFGHLHSVDIWQGTDGGCGASMKHAEERLKKTKLDGHHVTLYKCDSAEWMQQREELSIDVVWIDGGHTYEVASKDLEEGFRISRNVLAVHDAYNLPGVYDALEDFERAGTRGAWLTGFRGIWLMHKAEGRRPRPEKKE